MFFQRLPFLQWLIPTAAIARREVIAGFSVGLMLIPQAVAYAALTGMPLITGISRSDLAGLGLSDPCFTTCA